MTVTHHPAPARPRVIDLHAHVVMEAAFGAAGRYGPELSVDEVGVPTFRIGNYTMRGMRYRGSVFMDPARRLEQMDRAGIDVQLLSPNPLTFFHRIDPVDAIRYCQVHNDAMADLVARSPGRLLGAAALPMQDVDAAIAELQRAVRTLGLVAAYVGTDFGFALDDARLDDFYRAVAELDVPLFLHPASTGGAEGPDDPRLGRFDLTILVGYAYDETLAIASLVLGGVLDRHPDLDVCISHGGGAMPFLAGRFAHASRSRPWVPAPVRENGFEHYLRKLWFDYHVDGALSQELLVATVGRDRLVFGTNFGGWDAPDIADEFSSALTANAERLLRLDGRHVSAG